MNAKTQSPMLRLERIFDATPKELWDAWTDPKQYAKWLNPAPGMDLVIHEWDLRPGGKVRFDMPQPDGNPNPQHGVFHVLEPHRRLVSGEADKSFLIEALFEPVGRKTRLIVNVTGLPDEWHSPATIGWNQGFDKLAGVIGRLRTRVTEREVVMTRLLNAPRDLVFRAWTEPREIQAWWGPEGFSTTMHEMTVKKGGVWRFIMHGPDGADYPNLIEYTEVTPPARLAWRHGSDEQPDQFRTVVEFAEEDGQTRVTMRQTFPTPQRLEEVKQFNAIELGAQTIDRLARHLPQMRQA